jgi:hypothetical protein
MVPEGRRRHFSRVDLIGGYQYSRINDKLTASHSLLSLDDTFIVPRDTMLDVTDAFDARNQFHGGTIGLVSISERGCWSLEAIGKIGFGNMRQSVDVAGQTVVTTPNGQVVPQPGGLLAQPSNIGRYARDEFCVIPEARLRVAYHVNCNLDVSLGYNFLYWSSVAMAAEQVSLNIDPRQQLPDPTFNFAPSGDFVAHGMIFGITYHH